MGTQIWSLEPGRKAAHPSLTATAAGLAPLLARRGGRAGTAQPRRGQGPGREGRQQLCTRVGVSTCAGQPPRHTCLTHRLGIPLPRHCPAGTSPWKSQGAHLRAAFPANTSSLCEQQPSHCWFCLGSLRRSPGSSSHCPLSLPRGLTVTHGHRSLRHRYSYDACGFNGF